ncbi:hypothetical protein [Castellaniella sp.]|uniref:hypothetical protein n=1 Tax=Castellaniella sp. TaxID=1955812 RepID=UPI002AFEE4B9|nr:hypothetical protein [Castellaniella sp.]
MNTGDFRGFKRWPEGLPKAIDWVVGLRYGGVAAIILIAVFMLWKIDLKDITFAGWVGFLGGISIAIWGIIDFDIQRVSLRYDLGQDLRQCRDVRFLPEEFVARMQQRETMSRHEVYAMTVWKLSLINAEVARREVANKPYSD